ncbi:hypothetical protein A2803_03880 [Candidatus Woesebacteria bacterium RIFCSPHIGHO2_01_FULL_44_21]|uniref:Glycosyl transferase family 1 domain-containing protein n=1 Tax=Candidatus Woesebacteria bacterium RIFCSPHIGHO2_01_FULL_44_21 TaxID=1802503 RepID=A0A1F7YXW0_9BACT|nr:MAG: hypothetical protein A2803_03880 [Candidatus Woesebacteria bacterium RIFCSPHIGHO2_01_FULL_44_21]
MRTIIYIFALAAQGTGISGGDRIFMEFARHWSKHASVGIYLSSDGRKMCVRQKLSGVHLQYKVSKIYPGLKFSFLVNYLALILAGVRLGLTIKLEDPRNTILYSASEFWMDSLPCLILKFRYHEARWVASWYQTAPNPLSGFSGGRYRIKALYYWLAQLPVKPLVARFANCVLVNNVNEKKVFTVLNKKRRVGIVFGAVPLEEIENWKAKNGIQTKRYDSAFQGRFHPQKGVVELVDIWSRVVKRRPKAKLLMIGDGPLMKEVKEKIGELGLGNNIKLLGYVFDGDKKYKIFSQSKLVVHPAFYDSGGMASAEAMAFGIPAVGFDLPAYKSYYPHGMIKVKKGDIRSFAHAIVELLGDNLRRNKLGQEAFEMIKKSWSWQDRADEIFKMVTSL